LRKTEENGFSYYFSSLKAIQESRRDFQLRA